MDKGGWGIAILVIAGVVLLAKRKEVAAVIKPPGTVAAAEAMTAGQAEALLGSPTELVTQNQAFVAAHPTAYSMIQQANIQIASGQASVGDVLKFQIDKAYYNKYVAEGGTATYEDFTLYSEHWTPEYEAAKQAAKDKTTQYRASDIISGYQITDAYGNITGIRMDALRDYVESHSATSPTVQEIIRRYPELVVKEEVIPPPAPAVAPVAEPEFDIPTYTEAYNAAVEIEATTGQSQYVAYSSANGGGYSSVSLDQAIAYGGAT